jgi:hypothetical protein
VVIPLKDANVHLTMNALQELVHLRKAWSIIGLAWITTVV